ncbi:hypothetical protein EJB05_33942, partial [Eragrostis curvula]
MVVSDLDQTVVGDVLYFCHTKRLLYIKII